MIEGQPSHTAMHVAAARAAHLVYDPEPHLLEDRLAAELLGEEGPALIESYHDDGPWVLLENRIFLALRARYVEDRLRAAYRDGARQYVILGAGLDSFAFRQPADLGELEIFEVDHPSTQQWKRKRIEALGWTLPGNVRLVACDFETTPASSVLRATGFSPDVPTVVNWMGVVMYLEKEIVAGALADLGSILAPGSEIVLDYMRPWDELAPRYHALREEMARYLKGANEPHVNRYGRDELAETIEAAGYEAKIAERSELLERYVEPSRTSIPLTERFGLAVARKQKAFSELPAGAQ